MPGAPSLRAWRPAVDGISEVLHARFHAHAYPVHTHDTWTLLIVDAGTVGFGLERHEHTTLRSRVTLLPPHVPHDGRSLTADGFRKRVVYLHADAFDVRGIGRSVDHPSWTDAVLRREVHHLHEALAHPADTLEAESRLALVRERLARRLARLPEPPPLRDPRLARRLREMLDAHVVDGISLGHASERLGSSPTHLVRAFRAEVGIPPHRYLTGRRLDLARRMLLDGHRAADVAVAVGFYDQAHLNRHFKALLGVTPVTYASPAGSR